MHKIIVLILILSQLLFSEWAVVKSTKNDTLVVRWYQKYGTLREEKCKAVFYDGKRYKLISPWKEIIIIESNTNDIVIEVK